MTFSEFSEKARGEYLQKITGEKELSIFEAKRRNLSERLQNYFFSAKQTNTQSNITQYYSQKNERFVIADLIMGMFGPTYLNYNSELQWRSGN